MKQRGYGFTLIELMVVVAILTLLVTITYVSYGTVQGRTHDTNVQNDLRAIATKIKKYRSENGVYPAGDTQLATLDIEVYKSSYGSPYITGGNGYNLVYCRMPVGAPISFALVAYSKSGRGFMYTPTGKVQPYTGTQGGSGVQCTAAGVPLSGTSSERDWLYDASAWKSYVGEL